MYYIVKLEGEKITIVDMYFVKTYKQVVLERELRSNGIVFITDKNNIPHAGIYCYQINENLLQVSYLENVYKGWIYTSYVNEEKKYKYYIVYHDEKDSHFFKSTELFGQMPILQKPKN
jgi:hypothetical protein